jgi:LemA protein
MVYLADFCLTGGACNRKGDVIESKLIWQGRFAKTIRDHAVTILLLITFALAAWAVIIYNRLVRDRQRVLTAWSDIDVQLKRRHDLIPKLVAAVEQYARYEQSTLQTLVELRNRTGQVSDIVEKGALEARIGGGLRTLIALAEAYPELKADQSFLQLQSELTEIENQIQYARRFYNGSVRNLNTRIDSFPDLLIARVFRYTPQPFFELDNQVEKEPPKVLS